MVTTADVLGGFIPILTILCMALLVFWIFRPKKFYWLAASISCLAGWPVRIVIACISLACDAFDFVFRRKRFEVFKLRDFLGGSRVKRQRGAIIPLQTNELRRHERLLENAVMTAYHNTPMIVPPGTHNSTIFLLRSWLRRCMQEHGQDCMKTNANIDMGPQYLIDVLNNCLVPYETSMRYFALSYVWGGVETGTTLRANLQDHMNRDSLRPDSGSIPLTVQNAMLLTAWLGFAYLWCDRLCIVQDDHDTKMAQILKMADIYANAVCTLIASDNKDADSGLHGIPNLSKPAGKYHQQANESNTWSSRAWTFQEEYFSTRRIWLASNVVFWECEKTKSYSWWLRKYRSEARNTRAFNLKPLTQRINEQWTGILDPFAHYKPIAEAYSNRKINPKYPADRFKAFSGFETKLSVYGSNDFANGFIQGLPVDFLDRALLWTLDSANLQREPTFNAKLTDNHAASWSWLAWDSPMLYSNQALFRYEGDEQLYTDRISRIGHAAYGRILNAVQWDVSGHLGSSSAESLHAFGERWQQQMQEMKSNAISQLGDTNQAVKSPLVTSMSVSYISCRTRIARFTISNVMRPNFSQIATLLTPCQRSSYAGLLEGRCCAQEPGKSIVLIIISEGCFEIQQLPRQIAAANPRRIQDPGSTVICNNPQVRTSPVSINYLPNKKSLPAEYFYDTACFRDEICTGAQFCRIKSLNLDRRYEVGSTYHYYNTLWAEENGDMYTRRGYARVAKAVFDKECVGEEDLTLG